MAAFYLEGACRLLLQTVAVAVHELVHTTCRIYQFGFTCVERVRCVGDFQLYQRIGLAFEFDGFLCAASRT